MTANEYLAQVRAADTVEAAYAIKEQAYAEALAKRLTVEEWNAIWIAYDRRSRPWRYMESNYTGD
jgi:hypothetical protein